jgi:hypothetical protein
VDVRLGSAAVKAERLDEEGIALILADGSRIEADRVLLATGRRPRVGGLGLNALGVEVKPGTAIPVDTTCRVVTKGGASPTEQATDRATDGPAAEVTGEANGRATEANGRATGLWAAGDVTGLGTHTHTARYQAGVVAANILGRRREADYRAIPRAVYTMPSVFAVGASPQGAAEAGITLVTAGVDLQTTARALVAGEDTGRVELYAHPDSKLLLGAAAVGPNAPDWMGELTVAIRAGVPLPVLADTVHAFPTYSEALEPAIQELAGKLTAQPGDSGTSREGSEPAGTAPEGMVPNGTVPSGTGPNGAAAPAGSDNGDRPAAGGTQNGDAGMRPAALAEPRGPEPRGSEPQGSEPRGSEPSNAANSDARSAAS